MRNKEQGFTLIELLIAITIMLLIAVAAAISIIQVMGATKVTNERVTAVHSVQNAGYWITRDAGIAEIIIVDTLVPPNFLVLTWIDREYGGSGATYHSVTYSFEDLSQGIGTLKRTHWSSAGSNEETFIADGIYYEPSDVQNTSKVDYQNPVMEVKLKAVLDNTEEVKVYKIIRRPNLFE